jgi:2'-5' RNA ligase
MQKRTFIALPVPVNNKLKAETDFFKTHVQGLNIKWVELNNLHLTLAFLGDSTHQQIEAVKKGLDDIVPRYKRLSIRLTHAGAFKSIASPQVLWLGIEAETALQEIVNDIKVMIQTVGFEPENRAFKPHLTIGRVKSFSNANNLAAVIHNRESLNETIIADSVIYYESTLMPTGPVYRPIEKYDLMSLN